jgi:hypothetical protein
MADVLVCRAVQAKTPALQCPAGGWTSPSTQDRMKPPHPRPLSCEGRGEHGGFRQVLRQAQHTAQPSGFRYARWRSLHFDKLNASSTRTGVRGSSRASARIETHAAGEDIPSPPAPLPRGERGAWWVSTSASTSSAHCSTRTGGCGSSRALARIETHAAGEDIPSPPVPLPRGERRVWRVSTSASTSSAHCSTRTGGCGSSRALARIETHAAGEDVPSPPVPLPRGERRVWRVSTSASTSSAHCSTRTGVRGSSRASARTETLRCGFRSSRLTGENACDAAG